MTATAIGTLIRQYRQLSGLSQIELAKLAGVGKTAVFDIEKGKETIQFDTLLKLLDVLNIKIKFEPPFEQENYQ